MKWLWFELQSCSKPYLNFSSSVGHSSCLHTQHPISMRYKDSNEGSGQGVFTPTFINCFCFPQHGPWAQSWFNPGSAIYPTKDQVAPTAAANNWLIHSFTPSRSVSYQRGPGCSNSGPHSTDPPLQTHYEVLSFIPQKMRLLQQQQPTTDSSTPSSPQGLSQQVAQTLASSPPTWDSTEPMLQAGEGVGDMGEGVPVLFLFQWFWWGEGAWADIFMDEPWKKRTHATLQWHRITSP